MAPIALIPLRLLGFAASGFALGVGWKLGSHLVDVAMGEKDLTWPKVPDAVTGVFESCKGQDPLWKRKFSKVS